ncbi:MAG: hypothetical protein P8P70_15480, partial [Sulfitobacter sp.]|nr:hypothetical protein [Sulfitobacter sp.]
MIRSMGGGGNDTLAGSQGSDLIYGGDGNDLVYIGVPAAGDIAYDNEGLIYLEAGNDVLDAGDATLKFEAHGGDGNDTMRAGVGNDTLTGGADNDQMSGGAGNDLMSGDEGDDDLTGGEGDDTLDGGDGDDTFNYQNGFGHDTIVGGELGETLGDRLDASDVPYDSILDLSAGNAANPEDGILTVGDVAETGEHMVRLFKPDTAVTGFGVYPTGNIDFTQGEFFYIRVADLDAFLHDSQGMASGGGGDVDTTQNLVANFDGLSAAGDLIGSPGNVRHLDANGNQCTVGWVTDTYGNGYGHAILTFPNGESLTLFGVTIDQVSTPAQLEA